MDPYPTQALIGTRVLYRGFNFQIEATIAEVKPTRWGSLDVLLITDAGVRMWRSLADCTPVSIPLAVDLFDAVEVVDPTGQHYYGIVVDVTATDVFIHTDNDELVECSKIYIRHIVPAASIPLALSA